MADVPQPPNTARTSFTPLPDAKQPGDHYQPLPQGTKDGVTTAHARQTILVEPQALYEYWKDVTKIPLWQEHVLSVTPTSATGSHWVFGKGKAGEEQVKAFEFDSEMVEDIPGQKLAWKSVGGDIEQSGEVTFHARKDGRGTVVTLIQHFKVGLLASTTAAVAERGPKQTVIEDLRHFKQITEAGEIPNVEGQPTGPRGISGKIKGWMYGENNPTPPGTTSEA